MGFLFFKSKQIHPAECIDAYNKLSQSTICTFYLEKIPKYCAIDKILWIEAGIIENDIEKTIQNLGRIGSVGMQHTDNMILDIMVCK